MRGQVRMVHITNLFGCLAHHMKSSVTTWPFHRSQSDHYKRAPNIADWYNKVDNIGVHAINAYNRKWPQIHTLTATKQQQPTDNDDDNFSSSQQVKINETWYTNNSSRQTINWISSSTHLLVRPHPLSLSLSLCLSVSFPLSLNKCEPIGCDA